jgi:hypothetical protein
MIKKITTFVDSINPKAIEGFAWLGTACMLFSPYLLSYQIGFVLGAVGVFAITPPCIKNKQWNLVVLNTFSFIGYTLQILNIL